MSTDFGVDIPGVSITYTPTVNCNALVTISALPLPFSFRSESAYIYGTLNLIVNDEEKGSQYFSSPNVSVNTPLPTLATYSIMTRIVPLDAGKTYAFKLTARSWFGEVVFNNNPNEQSLKKVLPEQTTYFGVRSDSGDESYKPDKDSMKSRMTILFYSR